MRFSPCRSRRYRVDPHADPQALSVAVASKAAVHFIGMPEGNTALAQAAIYLATAPKGNAVLHAHVAAAEAEIAEPVPLHPSNAPTKLMTDLGYGKGYRNAHDEAEGISDMDCLPPAQTGRWFYEPTDRGFESIVKERLTSRRARTSPSGTSRREAEG
jgi:putative ATPase